jgi:hypothetical protein
MEARQMERRGQQPGFTSQNQGRQRPATQEKHTTFKGTSYRLA